jgi:hypothetical protein
MLRLIIKVIIIYITVRNPFLIYLFIPLLIFIWIVLINMIFIILNR